MWISQTTISGWYRGFGFIYYFLDADVSESKIPRKKGEEEVSNEKLNASKWWFLPHVQKVLFNFGSDYLIFGRGVKYDKIRCGRGYYMVLESMIEVVQIIAGRVWRTLLTQAGWFFVLACDSRRYESEMDGYCWDKYNTLLLTEQENMLAV